MSGPGAEAVLVPLGGRGAARGARPGARRVQVSYWCSEKPSGGGAFAFRTPSGLTPKPNALPHLPYRDVTDAVFFVWRPYRWANWMFEVASYDRERANFTFGRGGNQGARGDNRGGDWFVENVFEELDWPGEVNRRRRLSPPLSL